MALLGVWRARRGEGRSAVVTTPIEHKAVLAAAHQAAKEGGEERLLAMSTDGLVDDASFDALVDDKVAICSVMWVNNEIGVLQPVSALAARARTRGVVFHTDAVQAFGKVLIDARTTPFDVLSISGHKIGAPKGIGAPSASMSGRRSPRCATGSRPRCWSVFPTRSFMVVVRLARRTF